MAEHEKRRRKTISFRAYNPQDAEDAGTLYSPDLAIPILAENSSALAVTKLLAADGTFAVFNVRHPDFAENYQQIQVNFRHGEEAVFLARETLSENEPPEELVARWYFNSLRPELVAQFPEVFERLAKFQNMDIPVELTALAQQREDWGISEWREVAKSWNATQRDFMGKLIGLNGFYQLSELLDWIERLDSDTPSEDEAEVMSVLCLTSFAQKRLEKALAQMEIEEIEE